MSNKPTVEQEKIIKALGTNVAVSAGAGSGKTKVLIERFLYILEQSLQQGTDENGKYKLYVDQIVAITFTKAAAGEMRSRLRRSLRDKLDGIELAVAHCELDKLTAGMQTRFWQEQLERLPRTHISTIHSLCSFLLRENPLEANLDPQFTVAEEFEGQELVEQCLEQYLRRALKHQDEHVLALVTNYGLQGFMAQVQILLPRLAALSKAGDLQAPYRENLASLAQDKETLCELLREFVDRPDLFKKPATAAYKNLLTGVKARYEELCAALKQEPADFSGLQTLLTGVQAKSDFKELVHAIKDLMAIIAAKSMDALALPIVEHWQAVLTELAACVKERKQAVDLLTFDDLETQAIALLQKFQKVRHKYQQRFAQLMVDEFQDTNDQQRQLIYLLCGDSSEHLGGQKLFVVGDPKQSIYRFRGADVSVFKRVQEEIVAGGGQSLSMNKNFRSKEAVLAAVNTVFEPLLGTDTEQDVYFEALAADTPRLAGGVTPELYTSEYNKEAKDAKYVEEAELVAAKILQLHQGGRPFSEMTILLRATTRYAELLPVLQKYGIPFVLASGSGFYKQQEVLDILNLLQVLANKYANIALAGILRSPYFGVDDETLTQLFLTEQGECLWDKLQLVRQANNAGTSAEQAGHKSQTMGKEITTSFTQAQWTLLVRAGRLLMHLRQEAASLGLVELMEEIWRTLQVTAVVSHQPQSESKLANVAKLRSLVQEFVQEQQGTLASWLAYVAKLREYGSKEPLAVVESREAVQIMTIHASKGLQFPIVLLPFLEAEEQANKDGVLFLAPNKLHAERSWGLGVKVLAGEELQDTYLLQQLRAEERRAEFAERKRLLYVAMTRAEEQLLLFACGEAGKEYATEDYEQKNWFVQLESIMWEQERQLAARVAESEAGGSAEAPTGAPAILRGDSEETLAYLQPLAKAEQQEQVDVTSPLIKPLPTYASLGTTSFSPSALQSYAHCQRYYFYHYGRFLPEVEQEVQTDSTQLEATILGQIVHSTLEYYQAPQYDAQELERCLKLALKEHLPEGGDTTLVRTMLTNYLQSELVPPLDRAQKETNFSLYVAGLTISGFIDCMYVNADGTWNIIDYKSGRVPEAGAEKNAGYMYQLALYRLAVETLWQRQVTRCELHYLQGLKAVGLEDEAEYRKYLAEALALCKTIGAKENTEEAFPCMPGKQCEYCGYGYMCKWEAIT